MSFYQTVFSYLRYKTLYDSLDLEVKEKKFGHDAFEELSPISAELPTQAEQIEIKIHKMQHVHLKFNQQEIKKLWQADPQYFVLIEKMKAKI